MNKTLIIIATAALTLSVSSVTHAIPGLQLDAEGGVNDGLPADGGTGTTICSTFSCDFYAIATPKNNPTQEDIDLILDNPYYVSIALMGPGGTVDAGGSFGSFDVTINGVTNTVLVTDNMVFGVPPLETVLGEQGHDAGDLSQHSIFPTYFTQVAIDFIATDTIATYNVQDDAGTPASRVGAGDSFYDIVTIDWTDLSEGYQLHLDLYNTEVEACDGQGNQDKCVLGDIDVGDFAPYDVDAETRPIGANVTINKDAQLGDNTVIGEGSTIHKDVIAGDDLTAGTNVTIHKDVMIGTGVIIGDNTVIHKGTVIGKNVTIGLVGGGVGVFIGKDVTIPSYKTIGDGDVIPNNTTVLP